MLKIFKKVAFYLVLAVFFLGVLLIWGTLRAQVFQLTLFLTGVLLLLTSGAIIFLTIARESGDGVDTHASIIQHLKKDGLQIDVDLTQCKVFSNGWTEREEKYDNMPRVAFMNAVSGNSESNFQEINVNQSVIVYATSIQGKTTTFVSPAIAKDKATLMMLLEMQRNTLLYVDPANHNIFYFDLAFLQ
ncbi:hypothetical protein [Pseudochryseolinea flava]|uniref:Uncharacterized protein n=1 Tax=Pseudochryseolinea flava TaxID=2059302 RepID=A0A364Y6K2_9BACT|nr:hypothetical protein [Pseudochryseolinea flava]RAW01728.1 hypothetical protein DQQ10_08750 [Pseudochryseolinea flava]